MGQDLRELLRNNLKDSQPMELSKNHEFRFLDKLDSSFPEEDNSSEQHDLVDILTISNNYNYKKWFSVAASLVLSFSLGLYMLRQTKKMQHSNPTIVHIEKQNKGVPTLADYSPEFKKVEDLHLTTINVGLSEIEVNKDNKEIVNSYLKRIKLLEDEYYQIQSEFQLDQVDPSMINILMENLQMRLSFIEELKQELKRLNEYNPNNAYQNLQT